MKLKANAITLLLGIVAAVITLGSLHAGDDKGFKPLFNGKNLKGWKIKLKNDKGDPAQAFVVKDGQIQVPGNPGAISIRINPIRIISYNTPGCTRKINPKRRP
jgi:hypothetical protein